MRQKPAAGNGDPRPFSAWLDRKIRAKQIEARRDGQRLTLVAIAAFAGIHPGYLRQILIAERQATEAVVAALAEALGEKPAVALELMAQQRINIHDDERAAMVKRLPKRKSRTAQMEARAS